MDLILNKLISMESGRTEGTEEKRERIIKGDVEKRIWSSVTAD